MKCQVCKLHNAVAEAAKHPSATSQFSADYARKRLKVNKYRCEDYTNH